jgi:hypothetical protein
MPTWDSGRRAGGPVDDVFAALVARFPAAHIERLAVAHPADDDNVYWISLGGAEIQVDTSPDGRPPYRVEDDSPPVVVADPEQLWRVLVRRLGGR